MAQDIKDFKLKHRGLRGVFCVDDFRDAIQSYRRRVDDLKTDFVVIFPLPDFSCHISQSAVDPFSGRLQFESHADALPVNERDATDCCVSL